MYTAILKKKKKKRKKLRDYDRKYVLSSFVGLFRLGPFLVGASGPT